jgi:hypothetical protein
MVQPATRDHIVIWQPVFTLRNNAGDSGEVCGSYRIRGDKEECSYRTLPKVGGRETQNSKRQDSRRF